jgi:hypothetical protein
MAKTKKMDSVSAVRLNIANFKQMCLALSPDICVMVRGKHGIGKSQVVQQIGADLRHDFYKDPTNCARMVEALKNEPCVAKRLAKSGGVWTYEMGLPVIDKRLSQLGEGDTVGLPKMGGRFTQFLGVDWLINACDFPVVLFLDELNRAIKQVEQATFQLADSKAFNGNLLHDGTRLYTAVNIGGTYNVEEFDPAAISRYAVVDLKPTVKEFLEYARTVCNPLLVEFIATNEDSLEDSGDEMADPNQKSTDRRAWVRLDEQLTQSGLYNNPKSMVFHHIACAMVGFHHGNLFAEFVKSNQMNVSGEEIARGWKEIRGRLPKDEVARMSKMIELTVRLGGFLASHKIELDEVKTLGENISQFMEDAPPESVGTLWAKLSVTDGNQAVIWDSIAEVVTRKMSSKGERAKISSSEETPASEEKKSLKARVKK